MACVTSYLLTLADIHSLGMWTGTNFTTCRSVLLCISHIMLPPEVMLDEHVTYLKSGDDVKVLLHVST